MKDVKIEFKVKVTNDVHEKHEKIGYTLTFINL